jgi:hypothetical protein
MAVAFDAKPTGYNSADGLNHEAVAATSISASTGMTVGASATVLVAQLVFGNGAGIAAPTNVTMTWNGVSMTQRVLVTSVSGNDTATSIQFTLDNPAPGTNTLAASWTTAQDCYMSCASFTGAQYDTFTSNSQLTSLAINTTSDGATVACFAGNGSVPTLDQTRIWSEAPNTPAGGGSYAIGGTGSNTHTFTGGGAVRYCITGISLISAIATEQEGARFGMDDGAEAAHSWAAAQDTDITAPAGETRLVNLIVNASSSIGAKAFKLQYRRVGDAEWRDMPLQ